MFIARIVADKNLISLKLVIIIIFKKILKVKGTAAWESLHFIAYVLSSSCFLNS